MSFSSSSAMLSNGIPRFHQIRQDESLANVADKYSVDLKTLIESNPGAESPGDIVVIDPGLKNSGLI